MNRLSRLSVVFALTFCGCGDDDTTPTPSDAGVDASALDSGGADAGGLDSGSADAGDFDAGTVVCGGEPRVHATGRITSFSAMDTGVVGAHLTADLCPGVDIVTDATGHFEADFAQGMAFNGKITATGFLPERAGEQNLSADIVADAEMFPMVLSALLPHWGADRPTVLAIAVRGDQPPLPDGGVGGACDGVDGVTFSVTGHPEAVVTYYSGTTAPTPDASLTATGPNGVAEISGLAATAPGAPITLTASKAGCSTLSFVSYPFTGRFVLENGVLTGALAFMVPFSAP